MAIWQFDIEVIPSDILRKKEFPVPTTISRKIYESVNWWENSNLSCDFEKQILKILPKSTNWCKEIKQWGIEDGTCIQLIYEKTKLVEFIIRLDLRNLSKDLIRNILTLITDNKCVIIAGDYHIIKPCENDLYIEIKKSRSYKYVSNPREYLKSLKKQ